MIKEENISKLKDLCSYKFKTSIRMAMQRLDISFGSHHEILKSELNLSAYKIQTKQILAASKYNIF